MEKDKDRFANIKELRRLVRAPFKHYGRNVIYEDEFFKYFRDKGWSDEDIERLWIAAIADSGIVKMGVIPEAKEYPPKEIIGRPVLVLTKYKVKEES